MGRQRRVVAIIQARMGSTRFPGKMMRCLGTTPLIEWILTRVALARRVDQVVLVTSRAAANDVLEDLAARWRVPTVRGEEEDVLGRYVTAAGHYDAELVVRVCGDNPFVAPEEVDRVIECYKARQPDYAFNHVPRMGNGYPNGLGAEVFSRRLLQRLGRCARDPRHREHVTGYLWDHVEAFDLATPRAPEAIAYPGVKLDVDCPADLERLNRLSCAGDLRVSACDVVQSYLSRFGREVVSGCS